MYMTCYCSRLHILLTTFAKSGALLILISPIDITSRTCVYMCIAFHFKRLHINNSAHCQPLGGCSKLSAKRDNLRHVRKPGTCLISRPRAYNKVYKKNEILCIKNFLM